jgi:hypothetical protein
MSQKALIAAWRVLVAAAFAGAAWCVVTTTSAHGDAFEAIRLGRGRSQNRSPCAARRCTASKPDRSYRVFQVFETSWRRRSHGYVHLRFGSSNAPASAALSLSGGSFSN